VTVDNYNAEDDYLMPGEGDVRNPYPGYADLRAQCPVVPLGVIFPETGRHGQMVVTRAAIDAALEDGVTYSTKTSGEAMRDVMGRTILEMEGAEHLRHRKLVAHAFRPRAQARWDDEIVRPLVNELIDGFEPSGRAELVKDLLYQYPIQVISRILGLDDIDPVQFQRWAVAIISHATSPERGLRASAELEAYLRPIIAQRRAAPQSDVISDLVTAEIDGQRLTDEEILPFLKLLMPAGGETTYRATGNLLFALLSHPDQLDRVAADRSLLSGAIDEALRWEPPLQMIARAPHVDAILEGCPVSQDDMLILLIASANHDPVLGEDLGAYDIERGSTHHLTFGSGAHMCLGMHLAKMEMRVAVEVLLDRLPGLRLDPEAMAVEDPPHIHGSTFRSPTSLPVIWG
jgi:cytochrome P450